MEEIPGKWIAVWHLIFVALPAIAFFAVQFHRPEWRWTWIGTACLFSFVISFWAESLRINNMSNLNVYYSYEVVMALMWWYFGRRYIRPKLRPWFGILAALAGLIIALFAFGLTPAYFYTLGLALSLFTILSFSFLILYDMIHSDEIDDLFELPDYWFWSAILINTGFNSTLMLHQVFTENYSIESYAMLSLIMVFSNVAFSTFTLIGLLKWKKSWV